MHKPFTKTWRNKHGYGSIRQYTSVKRKQLQITARILSYRLSAVWSSCSRRFNCAWTSCSWDVLSASCSRVSASSTSRRRRTFSSSCRSLTWKLQKLQLHPLSSAYTTAEWWVLWTEKTTSWRKSYYKIWQHWRTNQPTTHNILAMLKNVSYLLFFAKSLF